ncbi:MAG: hypothetical protein OEY49_13435 [Candidatus Heimdallarchaeota archaeon]|nr:hypothetical protein [Candidatus Heimdallarchaeota archaeon]
MNDDFQINFNENIAKFMESLIRKSLQRIDDNQCIASNENDPENLIDTPPCSNPAFKIYEFKGKKLGFCKLHFYLFEKYFQNNTKVDWKLEDKGNIEDKSPLHSL